MTAEEQDAYEQAQILRTEWSREWGNEGRTMRQQRGEMFGDEHAERLFYGEAS